ncbi:MAG: cyclic nucleotide-binding domain-containing protein [Chloroflexi bacterium]|nr:cyclic nucleotide-binding domain-containing protein [Chloroflexota bacterium]
MVSPELIRRYPFFAGLTHNQVVTLARVADELEVAEGHVFLREGERVPYLYFVAEGEATATTELPAPYGEVALGAIGPGEVFAWSALIPPHTATASVKASAPCRVVVIDCRKLLEVFEGDPRFGYQMMTKAAQVTRDRVSTMNMEALAFLAERKR